jgi:hypothetical protein
MAAATYESSSTIATSCDALDELAAGGEALTGKLLGMQYSDSAQAD